MFPYFFTFTISFLTCNFAEKELRKKNSRISTLLFTLAVLIVAILAGCRDLTVGPDTISYTRFFFDHEGANFSSFGEYYHFFSQVYEPGFVIFEYVLSQIYSDSHWMLFWAAIIIYGFTMKSLVKYKEQCSVSLVWLLFLTLTCTEAFNIIRQYMGMAVGLYGFTYAMENKYKKFIVWILIAISFHFGAVVYVPLYLIYQFLKSRGTRIKPFIIILIVILALVVLPSVGELSALGFVGTKLSKYFSGANYSFQVNPFLIRLPFLLFVLLQRKRFISGHNEPRYKCFNNSREGEFFVLLLIIELILSQTRGINVTLYRLTSFLGAFKFISYSRIVCLQKGENKYVMLGALMLYMAIIFVYWVAIVDSGIYPYTSEILGIR